MIREVEELFERQTRAWPLLANGIEGLARAKTRPVRIDWFDVWIRHIPHRIASTNARVDPESIAKRACFLCPANLPSEEEGISLGEDFTIYCNPFPIVDRHLTIAHREHRAQRIETQFGAMLDIAAALPSYFVIYNGPESGASAPDHLHFQAGSRKLLPIEKDTSGLAGVLVRNYCRNVLLFHGHERTDLIGRFQRVFDLLAEITHKRPEPLINIACFRQADEWVVYVFPRAKHRPRAFYTGELTVSPAAIDLCGIFVVPLERDFERISADAVEAVYREVTLPDDQVLEIVQRLESKR